MTVPKSRERISGNALQKAIIDLAHTTGWLVAHFTAVKTEFGWRVPVAADGKGFPDLILVRDRILAIEVKGDGDTLRKEQKTWQGALLFAGVEYHVATPKAWTAGEIDEALRFRAS